MDLPSNAGVRKNSGISFVSVEIMWLGMMSLVKSNQNPDMPVRIFPLLGMRLLRMISKALILSLATMTRESPQS